MIKEEHFWRALRPRQLHVSSMVKASGRPHVVVIGGGAGGATAARYLAKDSEGTIEVTLIEPSRHYYTCFSQSLYWWFQGHG